MSFRFSIEFMSYRANVYILCSSFWKMINTAFISLLGIFFPSSYRFYTPFALTDTKLTFIFKGHCKDSFFLFPIFSLIRDQAVEYETSIAKLSWSLRQLPRNFSLKICPNFWLWDQTDLNKLARCLILAASM